MSHDSRHFSSLGDETTCDPDMRLEIHPQPNDDELIAIFEVMRAITHEQTAVGPAAPEHSRWEVTARQESLRAPIWPPQMDRWVYGDR